MRHPVSLLLTIAFAVGLAVEQDPLVLSSAHAAPGPAPAEGASAEWRSLPVPGAWEDVGGIRYDGFAWYRCSVLVPAAWSGRTVTLAVEQVDNAHEAFFNGARVGGAGHFPPNYQNGVEAESRYVVPPERLKPGGWNTIALRVFDHDGRGGFKGPAPQLGTEQQHISLGGAWQFRTGDQLAWAESTEPLEMARFSRVDQGAVPAGSRGHEMAGRSRPLPPAESASSFQVPDDLEIEQVLAEPIVAQPVFLNFDERGRMWVVQYRQYPAPAGLTVVSKDIFWRAVYDRVPAPPPRGAKGLDRITIHEDTNGDGIFDRHRTFVDGLNIATACVKGRGGVWVLNPPYLLFYPDRNEDDVPDGDPEVKLEGFGLEDTHSVINSLRWGPDGWLYAAQGSTVTGHVRAPGETNFVFSQGQHIWRYHPETRRYEIFAEGGGNAFGVEIDSQGRIFSGHNGGDTRGFHYAQGAYLRKGFEKHGELANPYAFGYFPHMTGTSGERFTHTFLIEAGGAFPDRYRGKLFGVEPLQGRVVLSDIQPEGTTFVTKDLERVVTSRDSWFRPVDIKPGPDGAIYICDWYDRQVTHTRNQEGNIDASNGRIYRLKRKGAKASPAENLGAYSSAALVGKALASSNTWVRQTALRLLGDRRDQSIIPLLRTNLAGRGDQLALESLWALNLVSPAGPSNRTCRLPEDLTLELLQHPNPQVRIWTARLMGDDQAVTRPQARALAAVASERAMSEVRAQLASTARRLPASDALPMVANLLGQDGDVNDTRLPLLIWWAIEAKCGSDRDAVLRLFEDSSLWFRPMTEKHILDRLMRRFAAAGSQSDLLACARLLELSPGPAQSAMLMRGFEEAFQGRSLAVLPDELSAIMARRNVGSDVFRVRQQDPAAVNRAIRVVEDPKSARAERLRFLEVLGEVHPRSALDVLLRLVEGEADPAVRPAVLAALRGYDDPRIPESVVRTYAAQTPDGRLAALALLGSRLAWANAFVQAVDAGRIRPTDVSRDGVRRLQIHESASLRDAVARLWPKAGRPSTEAMQQQIARLSGVVQAGRGDPYAGQKLFQAACASCHQLFARGGKVGPDLTTYQRSDVDALLLQIVNPSAEIREGYENFLLETTDGRSLTGFLVRRDEKLVVLRGPDGQNVSVEPKEMTELRAAGMSLMPEGLLDGLTDQQIRDLFAYLRSTQPLAN
jgi:putative heme-binding domain-containing protein